MNKKTILTISILICLMFFISAVSAEDSDLENMTVSDEAVPLDLETAESGDDKLSVTDSDESLGASTVYFDASATIDGDGSQSKPYKYLKANRLDVGTTAYFADGVYNITDSIFVNSYSQFKTSIIGQSRNNTVFNSLIEYDFIVSTESNLVLKNLRFDGANIINRGNLDVSNVHFENTKDTNFGVICSPQSDSMPTINIDNCIFYNNKADYYASAITSLKAVIDIKSTSFLYSGSKKLGGAIYAENSRLSIKDTRFDNIYAKYGGAIYSKNSDVTLTSSSFNNTYADNFGGAVSSDNNTIVVNKCSFNDCRAISDAGGSLYSIRSNLKVYDSSFSKGNAGFGGAICNLKTDFIVKNSVFKNNKASEKGQSIYNAYGDIEITGNNFTNDKTFNRRGEAQPGAIINELIDSLTLKNNRFIDADSIVGHKSYIDGFSGEVTQSNNIFRDTYTFACIYNGVFEGKEIQHIFNYLLLSVSNDGTYLTPTSNYDDDGENTNVSVNIRFDDSSTTRYTTLTQNNKVVFDLTKKSSKMVNKRLDFYIIDDDTAEYWLLGSYSLEDKNYANQVLVEFNFNELMNSKEFGIETEFSTQPAPQLFNFTQTPENHATIPSSYDSRDYGYITPVKHQYDGGNCWAFAGMSALEASIKKATGMEFDFAEENAKNIMAEFSAYGMNKTVNRGGYQSMFIAYLVSWLGPEYEIGNPYDPYSAISPIDTSNIHIQDVYLIAERKNTNDNDNIKRAIMDYAAVSIAVPNWEGDNGHAVTLIGWDDNYNSFDVFGQYAKGAWIFKNSWGSDWNDNGFYYLSYEKIFYNPYAFVLKEDRGYTNIYQYDFAGHTNTLTAQQNDIYYRNKFTATQDEILSAASTYFTKETDYTLSVYLNGNLVTSQNGHTNTGYYTIPLENEISLKKGDEFTVQFRCRNSNRVPISDSRSLNKLTYGSGVSFISTNGIYWEDVYDIIDYNNLMVACIKAFTRQTPLKNLEISIDSFSNVEINREITIPINITESYIEDGMERYIFGHVRFDINDKIYYGYVSFGSGELKVKFDKAGHYNLKAQYISNKEISNVVSFSFDVVDNTHTDISIEATDISKYYGQYKEFTAQVLTSSGGISGANVKVSVDGNVYTLKTDTTGRIYKNLDLKPGSHIIYYEYNGVTAKSKYVVKSTVGAHNTQGEYKNTKVSAVLLDKNGNFLTGGQAVFKIGTTPFTATISKNGVATAEMNVGVGSYNVEITNPQTGEKATITLEVVKKYQSPGITTQQNGDQLAVTVNMDSQATGYVYLYVDDVLRYGEIKDGKITFTFDDFGLGEHSIKMHYLGDDNFIMDTKTTKLINSYIIQSNPFNAVYGQNKNIALKLLDYKGNAIGGAKVSYSVTGAQTFSGVLTTSSSGDASLKFNRAPGTYHVKLTSANNGYTEYTIKISKANAVLKASKKTFKLNKAKKYKVTLKGNGKALKSKKITLKVNGKTYKAKTNAKGVATIKITKLNKKGTFKALVKYAGDKYYNKATKNVNIKVK